MILKLLKITVISLLFSSVAYGQLYDRDGNQIAKTRLQREPYEIIDTLTVIGGFGSMVLNKHFTDRKNNVRPTSAYEIFPSVLQIISDTSQTVSYFAIYISDNRDTLIVKSNNTSDTLDVRVRVLMR